MLSSRVTAVTGGPLMSMSRISELRGETELSYVVLPWTVPEARRNTIAPKPLPTIVLSSTIVSRE